MLNDEDRGATVEAVISRMKTVQTAVSRSNDPRFKNSFNMRLIAISATVLNVDDVSNIFRYLVAAICILLLFKNLCLSMPNVIFYCDYCQSSFSSCFSFPPFFSHHFYSV